MLAKVDHLNRASQRFDRLEKSIFDVTERPLHRAAQLAHAEA
ncbi:hypothetical protein [Pseudophaeobacter sp. EL27]|nr:hypothetical protein [Pseudophaeobacter sp. EL27]